MSERNQEDYAMSQEDQQGVIRYSVRGTEFPPQISLENAQLIGDSMYQQLEALMGQIVRLKGLPLLTPLIIQQTEPPYFAVIGTQVTSSPTLLGLLVALGEEAREAGN